MSAISVPFCAVSLQQTSEALGRIVFSPGGEEWVEFGPEDARRRVGFHDYAAIYAVPGLYERIFYEELGMCSTTEVVALFGRGLAAAGRDPAAERVLDLGAGSGAGGEELRRLGVPYVVGLDLEPVAREAAGRDRPGAYDDYLVGDLGALPGEALDRLREHRLTSLVALAAIGVGHVPPPTLEIGLGLLAPGGLFAFAIASALLPDSEDEAGVATGYPDWLAELFSGRADELGRHTYMHRIQTDGTPHDAVAVVGRLRAV